MWKDLAYMRTLSDAFEIVKSAATKNDPLVTKYKHAAAIVTRKGQLIATGRNNFQGGVVETPEGPLDKTIHAEINALSKVSIRRLQGAVLVSYGRTDASTILARPCTNCWAVLKKLGFKKVFYTIYVEGVDADNPTWREENF